MKITTETNPNWTKGGYYRKTLGYKVEADNGKTYYIQSANYEATADCRFSLFQAASFAESLESFDCLIQAPTKAALINFITTL